MRTRETIEALTSQGEKKTESVSGKIPRGKHPKSLANLIAPWNHETAPRNGGRPKKDVSHDIARQVFENNPELIYKAFAKQLTKGGAFAFQVLSERAYGKLKETRDIGSELNDVPDGELNNAIKQIEERLGLAREIDAASAVGIAAARAEAPTVEAKDS